jgi:uncharacterized membrane protein
MATATPEDIDRDAPVIAHHEVDIAAPIDVVWDLHTDVDRWPSWNPTITAAKLDGDFQPGNSFTWTSFGFTVTSTIHAVADRSRTLWSGAAQGITGIHEWRFDPTSSGVHVTTDESFAGDPIQADTDTFRTALDQSLLAWLERLKTQAESVA